MKQADFFIRTVKLDSGDLPPVLDVELTGKRPKKELQQNIKKWLDRVEALAGTHPCKVSHMDGVRLDFDDGWVLMRKSVTAEQITLRAEADTPERLDELMAMVAQALPEGALA